MDLEHERIKCRIENLELEKERLLQEEQRIMSLKDKLNNELEKSKADFRDFELNNISKKCLNIIKAAEYSLVYFDSPHSFNSFDRSVTNLEYHGTYNGLEIKLKAEIIDKQQLQKIITADK